MTYENDLEAKPCIVGARGAEWRGEGPCGCPGITPLHVHNLIAASKKKEEY